MIRQTKMSKKLAIVGSKISLLTGRMRQEKMKSNTAVPLVAT